VHDAKGGSLNAPSCNRKKELICAQKSLPSHLVAEGESSSIYNKKAAGFSIKHSLLERKEADLAMEYATTTITKYASALGRPRWGRKGLVKKDIKQDRNWGHRKKKKEGTQGSKNSL